MRACELQAVGLDHLLLVERSEAVPGQEQVAVRVRAAALNSRDLQVIVDKYEPQQRLSIAHVVDERVFPFVAATDALRYLGSGAHSGKVCITVPRGGPPGGGTRARRRHRGVARGVRRG